MAQVYVANGTHQHREFHYRLPEGMTVRKLSIPAGRQQKFVEDFTDGELQSLVEQLERAGAVPVGDVNGIINPYSLVYSVKKQIDSDKIDAARTRDLEVRQDIAGTKTEEAGLASFATLAGENADKLKSASLEVTQIAAVEGRDEEIKGGVDFQATVSKEAGKPQRGKKR